MTDLRTLQRWFVHAMTHGEHAAEGATEASTRHASGALEEVLTRSETRTALERFSVYHHAYRARLLECLADDYPVLRLALGDRFDALIHRYVEANPSRHFSLNGYGAGLAAFVEKELAFEPEERAFWSELATLEWQLVLAVHAAGGATLALDAVLAVPPDAWEHAVLVPSPSLAILHFEHPVNAYFQHAKDHDAVPGKPPARAPTAVALCRKESALWRVELSTSGALALEALAAGTALLPALTAAGASEADVGPWFRTWMECGFFADVIAGQARG